MSGHGRQPNENKQGMNIYYNFPSGAKASGEAGNTVRQEMEKERAWWGIWALLIWMWGQDQLQPLLYIQSDSEEVPAGCLACLLESPTLWEESGESMYSSCCCCWGQLPGAGFISDLDPQPHLPCVYLALPFFGAPPTRPWTHIYLLMEGMEGLHQGSSRSPSGLKQDSLVAGRPGESFGHDPGRYPSVPKHSPGENRRLVAHEPVEVPETYHRSFQRNLWNMPQMNESIGTGRCQHVTNRLDSAYDNSFSLNVRQESSLSMAGRVSQIISVF